jgi:hypothetical protein
MDTAVRPVLLASDALVGLDAVRLVVDLPDLCPEAVPDFHLSASADAQEPQVAHPLQERLKPPPDALR